MRLISLNAFAGIVHATLISGHDGLHVCIRFCGHPRPPIHEGLTPNAERTIRPIPEVLNRRGMSPQISLRPFPFALAPDVAMSAHCAVMRTHDGLLVLGLGLLLAGCAHSRPRSDWVALFPDEGVPEGWVVRAWNDVRNPADGGPVWRVQDRLLTGGEPRGSWLLSEREYGDFILEFEFKLGERGNSGCALRAPLYGDPAFDGLELQMADFRYNPEAQNSELTGGLYRAVAPRAQVYRPTEWNRYRIECRGPRVNVELNGEPILDVNLDEETASVKRHDGTDAPPLKDRPRRGHIGFQELSRDGSHVAIRNVRIRVLE